MKTHTMEKVRKRRGISKKNKISWRKHIDIEDVEEFLNDQRLEERLGGSFNERQDEDIFKFDKTADDGVSKGSNKKLKAALPPKCLQILKPWTSVPDPISKRNRVRTKEERISSIRKQIEEKKVQSGYVKKKDIIARKSRELTKKLKLQNAPKVGVFDSDIWEEDHKNPLGNVEWLEEETNRHVLKNIGKLKIRNPKTFAKSLSKVVPSTLPATEAPHPGTSYNPSFTDHQSLLKDIAEKEMKLIKEEEHLNRVTSCMFSKVTPEENSNLWLTEMSEGLDKTPGSDDENSGDYKAINPPTSYTKKKTLKTKRKQREAKVEAHKKQKLTIEKKKKADIYKLRLMAKEIAEKEKKSVVVKEKKMKKKALEGSRTKKLAKRTYEEPDSVFHRPHEITGNLRNLKPQGSLLADRFVSMQKRNILEVTTKQLKSHRSKVKKFVKPGHRVEEPARVVKKRK